MRGARKANTPTFQATHARTTRKNAALYDSGILANPMLGEEGGRNVVDGRAAR